MCTTMLKEKNNRCEDSNSPLLRIMLATQNDTYSNRWEQKQIKYPIILIHIIIIIIYFLFLMLLLYCEFWRKFSQKNESVRRFPYLN